MLNRLHKHIDHIVSVHVMVRVMTTQIHHSPVWSSQSSHDWRNVFRKFELDITFTVSRCLYWRFSLSTHDISCPFGKITSVCHLVKLKTSRKIIWFPFFIALIYKNTTGVKVFYLQFNSLESSSKKTFQNILLFPWLSQRQVASCRRLLKSVILCFLLSHCYNLFLLLGSSLFTHSDNENIITPTPCLLSGMTFCCDLFLKIRVELV